MSNHNYELSGGNITGGGRIQGPERPGYWRGYLCVH